jgi:hypothetical protein
MQANPAAFPFLGYARRVDLTLTKGQVLLVPGGAPHRVVNGDGGPSVAVAGNFVDASNAKAAIADLILMAGRRAGAPPERGCATAARGLAELDLEGEMGSDSPPVAHCVPWAECTRGGAVDWLAEGAHRVAETAATVGKRAVGDVREGRDRDSDGGVIGAGEDEGDGGSEDDDDVSFSDQPPEWE